MASEGREEAASGGTGTGPREVALLVVGCVLFLASITAVTLTEGGKGEFGYAPFTPEALPWNAMRGFTLEQLVGHAARILLGTPGLLLVWLAVRRGAPVSMPGERTLNRIALAVSALSVALVLLFMLLVFRGRPIVDDEVVYRMQAALYREGKIAFGGLPYLQEVFTVKSRAGFTGKYLFGEPLLQMATVGLGYPALLHVPITAVTLLSFHRAVRLLSDGVIAAWSVLLLAASPMLILTSATGQSQAAALCCVALAGLGYASVRTGRTWLGAGLVGMFIGFCVPVRIQVAVPAGAVLVPLTLLALGKARAFGPALLLGLGLGAWALAVGAYDQALTGSALKLPWFLQEVPEHYGFGPVWAEGTFEHTPRVALENLLVVATRLNAWWLGWPSSFLALFLWYRCGRGTAGVGGFLWVGLAVVLFEAGYYSTGISDTGAIYHFELLLPGAVLAANAVRGAMARDVRGTVALLVLQFGLGWASFLWLEGSRVNRLVHFIHDEVEEGLSHVKGKALLLYEPRCPEAVPRGWIFEMFPFRRHSDRDPIVTFPRPPGKYLNAYLERYKDRKCWYYRIDPGTHEPAIAPCENVRPLLERPTINTKDLCLWNAPTASRLGLFDPWSVIKARQKADRAKFGAMWRRRLAAEGWPVEQQGVE